MSSPHAIIFDLDGTLTDPFDGITRSIRHALEALGVASPPDRELALWIGPPLRLTFGALLVSDDAELIERAVALYRERYLSIGYLENRPYPGVAEALGALRENGRELYVVTSKLQSLAVMILEHFGLGGYFKGVYGAEVGGRLDDKADLLAEMLRNEGVDAANSIMVGDTRFDMIAAANCGVRGVGVTYGYGARKDLVANGASVLCESAADLANVLLSIDMSKQTTGTLS